MTVCVRWSRINAQIILGYNMSWTLWWLIDFYIIELLLIFWSKKVLLKIIIGISLVSSWLHRPRILKRLLHKLLVKLSRCLLGVILSINAALKAGISVVCNLEGVFKYNICLIVLILGLIWIIHLRRIHFVQSVYLMVVESCLNQRNFWLSKFKQLVLAAILSLLKR